MSSLRSEGVTTYGTSRHVRYGWMWKRSKHNGGGNLTKNMIGEVRVGCRLQQLSVFRLKIAPKQPNRKAGLGTNPVEEVDRPTSHNATPTLSISRMQCNCKAFLPRSSHTCTRSSQAHLLCDIAEKTSQGNNGMARKSGDEGG